MAKLDYEPHPPGRRGEPLWWTNVKRSLAGAALLPVGLLTILLAVFAVGSIYEAIITPISRDRPGYWFQGLVAAPGAIWLTTVVYRWGRYFLSGPSKKPDDTSD